MSITRQEAAGMECECPADPKDGKCQRCRVLDADHAAEVSSLREQLEQTRVQLAGCGSAALGYADDCKQGEYGYSASLGDVLTLRRETVSLRAQLEAAEKRLDQREQVLGMYIDKLHEAHKRINALSKPASCRFCGGDTHAQLTAPPDGVRRLESACRAWAAVSHQGDADTPHTKRDAEAGILDALGLDSSMATVQHLARQRTQEDEMSEVKRYSLDESEVTEGYSDMTPDEQGEWVKHDDHAAEVSALREEHAKLKYAHGLEVAEVSHLRAQLEAAKADKVMAWKTAAELGDQASVARNEVRRLEAQLTAQPDGGLRAATIRAEAALEQACYHFYELAGHKRKLTEEEQALWNNCSDSIKQLHQALRLTTPAASTPPEGKVREWRPLSEVKPGIGVCAVYDANSPSGDLALHTAPRNYDTPYTHFFELEPLPQALAAPATAKCTNCDSMEASFRPDLEISVCNSCAEFWRNVTPAPAYDPKPDWRCKACEETGMRHCSDPANCGGMKPPAPACKTCGGRRKVGGYWDSGPDKIVGGTPCPDCNAGEGSSARATECSECGWIPDNGPGSFNGGFYRQCDKHRSKP
jgi:hypothetical protein